MVFISTAMNSDKDSTLNQIQFDSRQSLVWVLWTGKCICLLLWKASNIPSRHFNDSCLVFPSSRDSTSSANWTICIQNNSNPFISQEANLHYIHDVFRLPINKLLMHQARIDSLPPKTTHILTFWGGYLKIRTTAFRQEPQFLKGILHNLSTDCKLRDFFATFCIQARPGKPCESWYVQIRLEVRRLAGIWFLKLSQKSETYSHTVSHLKNAPIEWDQHKQSQKSWTIIPLSPKSKI